MVSTTTTSVFAAAIPTKAPARTAVKASSLGKTPLSDLRKRLGAPALVAGLAAAQITLFAPGPAMADYNPSIDSLSDADVMSIVTEIEDAEIPQLEISLGRLSGTAPAEAVASAQRELEAIERDAAALAEVGVSGAPGEGGPAAVGGILNEIGALKSMMQGMK